MSDTYMHIPLEDIEVNEADNPRKKAEDSRYKLKSLMENIEENHLINPITVEQKDDGTYTLVAGYRRLQAFKGLHEKGQSETGYDNRYATIPAITKEVIKDKLYVALSENLARKDLTEDEKAKGVYAFKNHTDDTIRRLADKLGISKTYADKLYQRGKQLANPTNDAAVTLSAIFINPKQAGEIMERTEKILGLVNGVNKLTSAEKAELTKTMRILLNDLNKIVSYIRGAEKKLLADAAVKKFLEEQKQAGKPAAKRGRPLKKFTFIK